MQRGPRTAAIAQWARTDLEFDDRSTNLKSLLEASGMYLYTDIISTGDQRSGPIPSIKPIHPTAKLGMDVRFKKVTRKERDCVAWKKTNRIARISTIGRVEYEYVCTRAGQVMNDYTPKSVMLDERLVDGLAPGMFIQAIDGLIVTASDKEGGKPIFFLGVMLK